MPALPPATNILRCVYVGTYQGAKWANVFHVRFAPGPPTQPDMNTVATQLRSAWLTNLGPLMTGQASLSSTTVTDLSSNLGLVGSNTSSAAGTGSTVAPLPANVALVGSFKIGRRYRGGHPRMYLTGQWQGNTTNANNWTSAWITTAGTDFNAWLAAVNAITTSSMTTIQLVNLSYFTGNALRPTPVFDTIGSVVVHPRIDTMRRRLGKELS